MKNAILYVAFICLMVPIAFYGKTFSQSEPADEGSQKAAHHAVDSETEREKDPASESEAKPQPTDGSVDK